MYLISLYAIISKLENLQNKLRGFYYCLLFKKLQRSGEVRESLKADLRNMNAERGKFS